jgi:hypothetical protein
MPLSHAESFCACANKCCYQHHYSRPHGVLDPCTPPATAAAVVVPSHPAHQQQQRQARAAQHHRQMPTVELDMQRSHSASWQQACHAAMS